MTEEINTLLGMADLDPKVRQAFDDNAVQDFLAVFRELLDEPRFMGMREWAETYRELPSDAAESGRYSMSRTPYLIEPSESLASTKPEHRIILMKKGAQLGASELGNNLIGWTIHQRPSNILFVQETEPKGMAVIKNRILPMLRTAVFKGVLGTRKLVQKGIRYPGGTLTMAGSHSPSSFSSVAAAVVFLDEYARYKKSVSDEGDALTLALQRLSTFGARGKLFVPSTPVEDTLMEGGFESHYQSGDCRQYYIPCPSCGEMDYLRRDRFNVVGEGEAIDGAVHCNSCGEMCGEKEYKLGMTEDKCEWRPTKERDNAFVTSYQLPGLLAPLGWKSWKEIAQSLRDADRGIIEKRPVINLSFGEAYNEEVETPTVGLVQERWLSETDMKVVPSEVSFLTMAVDIQKGYMRWEVYGWATRTRGFSVAAGAIEKDFLTPEGQQALDDVILTDWYKENGARYTARVTCIDSGYNTMEVYKYCSRFNQPHMTPRGWAVLNRGKTGRMSRTVVAVKGSSETDPNQLIVRRTRINQKRGMQRALYLHIIGVNIAKKLLYRVLRYGEDQRDAHGAVTYPADYPVEYLKELTSERAMVTRVGKTGRATVTFVKPTAQTRNEAIDLYCYNLAAATINGINETTETVMNKLRDKAPEAAPPSDNGGDGSPPSPTQKARKPKKQRDYL